MSWLQANEYRPLVQVMYKYPERFAHIRQRRLKQRGRALEEWVAVAEELACKNNGILPSYSWLKSNGYGHLWHLIHLNPKAFAHIPQDRRRQPRTRGVGSRQ